MMRSEHFIEKCDCGAVITQCRCPDNNKPVHIVKNGCVNCRYNKNKKKPTTIQVPIVDLALAVLRLDDLCPDVGMGMSVGTAIDEVLARYGLTRDDVDYPAILDEVSEKR